jgi:hypothetical protein
LRSALYADALLAGDLGAVTSGVVHPFALAPIFGRYPVHVGARASWLQGSRGSDP